jgi:hypothetical protein
MGVLLRRGFLNSLPSSALGSSASGLAPSPSVSTVRVPGSVLCTGLAPGGISRPELAPGGLQSPGFVTEALWASVLRPLPVMSYKPMQRYSCKLRGNRFLRMDESMIVEAV